MKSKDVEDDSFADYNEESNKKILNSKYVIMSGLESTRIYLLKDIHLIGVKKFLS